jgi:hypothetical protein
MLILITEYSFDSYSLLFFWILSILLQNNLNAFAIIMQFAEKSAILNSSVFNAI